jgi:Fe-S cluster biogenesis protein NfuA
MEASLIERVETAIDTIRPYLKDDGGDVRIVEITEDKKVILELTGACSTCPMSASTMKGGIEEAIKRYVPEIESVEALNLTSPQ